MTGRSAPGSRKETIHFKECYRQKHRRRVEKRLTQSPRERVVVYICKTRDKEDDTIRTH